MSIILDVVTVELVVMACQMDENQKWMQGDLEIKFNGEKPYSDDDIIDAEEFLKSIEQDGEYTIFSCCCGVPECSSWNYGIQVVHSEESIRWTNPNNGKTWCFDKQEIRKKLNIIRQEVENYKKFFSRKEITYVGVGYNW